MKILIIGAGWVGITMSVLFSSCHDVTLLDNDDKKIKKLRSGLSPIIEPGIETGFA